jgi:predicted kinase
MKEFKDFLIDGIVKKQYPDKQRAKDLVAEADRKFRILRRTIEKEEFDDENSNDIVEDCHDVILGLIRAKMLLAGFGASGQGAHEAEVAYLGELGFSEQEIEFVNKLRYFRNGIMYYGKRFDKEYAKKALDFVGRFKEKIKPFVIIIRGPLGIGKTTIAKALAKDLDAEYISFDKVLEENGLDREDDNFVPQDFIKANEIVLPKAKEDLAIGKIVIFDGCFYFKEQIMHLEKNLPYKIYAFDLKAPLKTCIARDKGRKRVYGQDAAKAVYDLVKRFDYGIAVNTENRTEKEVVEDIEKRIR